RSTSAGKLLAAVALQILHRVDRHEVLGHRRRLRFSIWSGDRASVLSHGVVLSLPVDLLADRAVPVGADCLRTGVWCKVRGESRAQRVGVRDLDVTQLG